MAEFVDVVIVGAGISGISAAWHLQDRCPARATSILERRENLGGTWDLFKYPGIRSDSDMFTLGFPVQAVDVGEGHRRRPVDHLLPEGTGRRVRHRQAHPVRPEGGRRRLVDADAHWTVRVERDGEEVEIKSNFLFTASGYYNYDEGSTPEFPGTDDFSGTIIHPQHWPEDLDYAGKRIVVIGSGATAVTLIPALADSGASHVTMLQRSPSYIGALPDVDPFTVRTNNSLPAKPAYVLNRWKSILFQFAQYQASSRFPNLCARP